MRNIRLTLAYDGTNYVGWQVQPNGPTVQAELEAAVKKLTGETVRVIASGRTDSGVHALGQVVNFPTESRIAAAQFCPGLENFLPDDIAVLEADVVADDFHATYSATRKRYRYIIHNSRKRAPALRNFVWRYAVPLDVDAMQAAADVLLGRHDFRCFESEYGRRASSVRTIFEASFARRAVWDVWQRLSLGDAITATGEFITFDVVADGFLYNMVRAIVGTLVHVGRGRWSVDDVRKIVASQDRSQAGETAPPQGLYLVEVDYEP